MKTVGSILALLLLITSPLFSADEIQRVGLYELSSYPVTFEGRVVETEGIVIQEASTYFPKPSFFIKRGMNKVRISPWLPLETAPAPRGVSRPRKKVMSDFIGKNVIVSGKVVIQDGKPLIEVKNAKSMD